MSCGIYKIENMVYIGQSVNIESRWYHHINSLNKRTHSNDYLQNAWNKYGACAFTFEILCLCSKDKLNELETYWWSKYQPNVYNLDHTSDITRARQSKSHLGKSAYWNKEQKQRQREKMIGIRRSIKTEFKKGSLPWNTKQIKCIETGEIFQSIKDAKKIYGGAIEACCRGVYKTASGYHWKYVNDID